MNAVPKPANTYEVLTLPTDKSASTNDLCYFRTRSGTLGLLQITGYTENPRGVKLRYKLVQNEKTNSVLQALPKSPTSAFQIRLVADDSDTDIPTDTLLPITLMEATLSGFAWRKIF